MSYQFEQLFSPLNAELKSSVDVWELNGLLTGIKRNYSRPALGQFVQQKRLKD